MDFGDALKVLRKGNSVARKGWNGKGLWLDLQRPDAHSKMTLPYIYINYPEDAPNTPGARVPWLGSQTDLLADDWDVVLFSAPKEEVPGADSLPPTARRNVLTAGRILVGACHGASFHAGWWRDLKDGTDLVAEVKKGTRLGKAIVSEKLALVHSEVSEALEGYRKDLMDDKLPHRTMVEVELADAVIRIADLAGAMNLDLGGAIAEKLDYNANRPDHKPENRAAENGKKF